MERVYSFSPGARMQPSEEKTIKQTHLSKSRYGMKCETSACIFSRSPNARNGMRRIKACRTVALARTNGLLIRSSSIINWSLSPHSFENSCTMTAISSHPSWAWWKDCGSLPPLSIFWISSTSLTVLGDLVVVWRYVTIIMFVFTLHYIKSHYCRVYGFGHLWADCWRPGSAPEPYSRFEHGTTFSHPSSKPQLVWDVAAKFNIHIHTVFRKKGGTPVFFCLFHKGVQNFTIFGKSFAQLLFNTTAFKWLTTPKICEYTTPWMNALSITQPAVSKHWPE